MLSLFLFFPKGVVDGAEPKLNRTDLTDSKTKVNKTILKSLSNEGGLGVVV